MLMQPPLVELFFALPLWRFSSRRYRAVASFLADIAFNCAVMAPFVA
jgi:hypothetical protein